MATDVPIKRVSDATISDATGLSSVPFDPAERAQALARLVIRDGKSFQSSALEAGYSEGVARNGLARLMADSQLVSVAVQREVARVETSMRLLKPAAITRLYREIVDQDSTQGIKAIELAGRFKETDWFVRNSDASLGVFLTVQETAPQPDALDIAKDYKE